MKDSMKYRLNKFFDIMATNFRGFRMYCMCLNVNWLNRVTAWHLRSNKIRIGFSDFWRRWHITLSSWLRDYLYIPLGGNRRGHVRTYINLMLTMLLGGLWHGASWTFVVWGALHGTYLGIERYIRSRQTVRDEVTVRSAPVKDLSESVILVRSSFAPGFLKSRTFQRFSLALLTFFLVNVTWVFFRAPDFSTAWRLLVSMFGYVENGMALLPTLDIIKVGVITILMVTTHWLMRNRSVIGVGLQWKWWQTGLAWSLLLIGIIMSQKGSDSFIYFQF